RGVVQDDRATVRRGARFLAFRAVDEQIAGRPEALDIVIGGGDVHDILGAALGHVTVNAARLSVVFAGRDLLVERGGVALPAHRRVVLFRVGASGDVVRIVAGGAEKLAAALQETGRAA